MKPINVGLLGIGTVGGGTFAVLKRNQEEIARRAGRGIVIKIIADREVDKARKIAGDETLITSDLNDVVTHPDVNIVIELIGGNVIAKELILKAIENGKHVVTANKALLALHGTEIFAAAQRRGVMVAFEAAVAGGIPIIKALREGLTANRIEWIAGIINGTSNFILSEMRDKGLDFDTVLKQAQKLGYAEVDPTFDIEGIDAAHKITIMAAIAFGIPMQFDKVYTEGITKLTGEDIRYAEELGYRIKLLGITKRNTKGIELRVHPTLIPSQRLIANVEGVMNAIVVKGDAVGHTLYYGAGAGAEPTASSVVADLVDVTRMHTADPKHRVPHLAFQPDLLSNIPILSIEDVETSYYLRLRAMDKPGVLADITRILAGLDISIDAMVQKEPNEGEDQVDIIMLTHLAVEKNINSAIIKIEKLPAVMGNVTRIRLEDLSSNHSIKNKYGILKVRKHSSFENIIYLSV
ncbi:MAG: homoserine dehydrogenase [Nitrosomonadaceae bacterium]